MFSGQRMHREVAVARQQCRRAPVHSGDRGWRGAGVLREEVGAQIGEAEGLRRASGGIDGEVEDAPPVQRSRQQRTHVFALGGEPLLVDGRDAAGGAAPVAPATTPAPRTPAACRAGRAGPAATADRGRRRTAYHAPGRLVASARTTNARPSRTSEATAAGRKAGEVVSKPACTTPPSARSASSKGASASRHSRKPRRSITGHSARGMVARSRGIPASRPHSSRRRAIASRAGGKAAARATSACVPCGQIGGNADQRHRDGIGTWRRGNVRLPRYQRIRRGWRACQQREGGAERASRTRLDARRGTRRLALGGEQRRTRCAALGQLIQRQRGHVRGADLAGDAPAFDVAPAAPVGCLRAGAAGRWEEQAVALEGRRGGAIGARRLQRALRPAIEVSRGDGAAQQRQPDEELAGYALQPLHQGRERDGIAQAAFKLGASLALVRLLAEDAAS